MSPMNQEGHQRLRLVAHVAWCVGEAWVDPESDQRFAFSNALDVAGFHRGEAIRLVPHRELMVFRFIFCCPVISAIVNWPGLSG